MLQFTSARRLFWLLSPIALALAGVCLAAMPAWADEFVHDFRGAKFDRKLVRFDNQESSEFIKAEEGGLRWLYEPSKAPNRTLAIRWDYHVRGDFAVTARYAIVDMKPPAKGGNGVGVEMYLMLADPDKKPQDRDGIPMTRLVRPGIGPRLTIQQRTYDADHVRVSKNFKSVPTTAATERGRLRIAREGPTLIASFAEDDAEAFQELHRFDIGTMDMLLLRFAGQTGGDPNASMDMRLLEFRLQADEFGQQGKFTKHPPGAIRAQDDAEAPGAVDPVPPPPTNRFVIWSAILGCVIVVAGLVAFLTRRRPASATSSPSAPAAMVAVACAACGKNLKVKEELAGKRVKCPSCGAAVPVPGSAV